MNKNDPAYPATLLPKVDISEDEYGRCFEVGTKARADGKPHSANPYKSDQRWLAWHDGWQIKPKTEGKADD